MAVTEENLHRQVVHQSGGPSGAGDDGGVGMCPQELENVVGRGLRRRPGAMSSLDVLQLPLAWDGRAEDVQLFLQRRVFAPHLLHKALTFTLRCH